jgi:hypothetical protein
MSSFLDKKDGMFDPLKRYAFTNISDQPFTFKWNDKPATVDAGETVELPEYLALHATRGLVDQIMQDTARKDLLAKQALNPMYTAPNVAGNMGIPAARKPIEDMILKEIPMDYSNDRTLDIKRQQVKEQLLADLSAQPSELGSLPTATQEEFVEVGEARTPVQVV